MRKSLLALLFVMLLAPMASAYGVTFYSPTMNPQYGLIFEKVIPDKPYVVENTKDKDVAITKMTFFINREASNAGITVYHLLVAPDALPYVPVNDSYEVDELKYSGFVPHDTTKLVYEFRVAKDWLENMSVARNHVVLHAYEQTTESWDEIKTEITGDDDDYVYFKASGIGYHYLMIGRSQSGSEAAANEVKTEVKKVEEPSSAQPAAQTSSKTEPAEPKEQVDMTTNVEQVRLDTTPTPVSTEIAAAPATTGPAVSQAAPKEDRSTGIWVLIVLAVIIAAVVIYLVAGKRTMGSSVDKELNNYITESLKRGKTKEEVRRRLLDVGWHQDRVEKALAKHKGANQVMDALVSDTLHSEPVHKSPVRHVEKHHPAKPAAKAKKK